MAALISMDVGTGSVRVGAHAPDGTLLGTATESYETDYPRPGWAEQRPQDWWDGALRALRRTVHQAHVTEVDAVTISTTSSTVVVTDRRGSPLRPAILWMDGRAAAEADESALLGHPALRSSGGSAGAEWLLTKAMWLARHEPELYLEAAHICEAQDYMNYRLTGRWAASQLNATCKWAYDVRSGFPTELYSLLGVPDLTEKIPSDVIPVGQVVGTVRPEIAAELGISGRLLVVQGGIDAHMGMIGTDSVRPGRLCMISGTSIVHLTHVTTPVYAEGIWGPYPDAIADGLWLVEGGQVSGGSVIEWLVKDTLGVTDYEALERVAAEAPIGANGLLVLDFWMGCRTPYKDPRLRGAILGMRRSHSQGELYRAVLEAVAYGTRNVLKAFEDGGVPHATDIRISAGLTKNELWMQMVADTLGTPVRVMENQNATLVGGALCGATAAGHFRDWGEASQVFVEEGRILEPDDATYARYDEGFARYRRAVEVLRPLFHELDAAAESG